MRSLRGDVRAAREVLRRTEEHVRAVLDGISDAVVTIDSGGTILSFNRAAARIFGYSAEEAVGRNVKILVPPAERDRYDGHLEQYRQTRARHVVGARREITASRQDGTLIPMELSVREIGDLELFVGVMRDLSERRALQEEVLRAASVQLDRIGQELHDGTQQELSGLSLLARGLSESLSGCGLDAQAAMAARLCDGIAEANRHVRSLARGMVPVPVRANELRSGLEELVRQIVESEGLQCRLDCPAGLEICDDATATHLYRIAQEALRNIVRHAEATRACVRLEQSDAGLVLEVCDDGVGIESRAARHRGAGLRLMEHRCELIGGRFTVESRKDGGTRVICAVVRRTEP